MEKQQELQSLDANELGQVIGGGNTEPLPWLPGTPTDPKAPQDMPQPQPW